MNDNFELKETCKACHMVTSTKECFLHQQGIECPEENVTEKYAKDI